MNLKNPFRRGTRSNTDDKSEPVLDVMRPWWAWGPLGLMWYGGHHDSGSNIDSGQIHHGGDGGNFHQPMDPGGGFGGFDGGAGGI